MMPSIITSPSTLAEVQSPEQSSEQTSCRFLVDTDAGFDDVVAIQCLLLSIQQSDKQVNNEDNDDNEDSDNDDESVLSSSSFLITTVCGSNTASASAQGLRQLFPHLDKNIVEGRHPDRPSRRTVQPDWLTGFRQRFAAFCQRQQPQQQKQEQQQHVDSKTEKSFVLQQQKQQQEEKEEILSDKVHAFLSASPDRSVNLFCLGPLSNLAAWLDDDVPHQNSSLVSLLAQKVEHVWILGGIYPQNHHNHNNFIPQREEFNFGQDPLAAARVFHTTNPLLDRIVLLPGDKAAPTDTWKEKSSSIGMLHHTLTMIHHNDDCSDSLLHKRTNHLLAHLLQEEKHYSIYYDPLCVFLYLHRDVPGVASITPLDLYVCAQTGSVSSRNDGHHEKPHDGNACVVQVVEQVDFEAYHAWFLQTLRQSSRAAPLSQWRDTNEGKRNDPKFTVLFGQNF